MDKLKQGLDEFVVADQFESKANEEYHEAAVDREDGIRNLNVANRLGRRFRSSGNISDEIDRIENLENASVDFRDANRHRVRGRSLENMATRTRSAGRRDFNAAGREFSGGSARKSKRSRSSSIPSISRTPKNRRFEPYNTDRSRSGRSGERYGVPDKRRFRHQSRGPVQGRRLTLGD